MRWLALAAALLVPGASAVAQDALSAQESLVAYCHGAWSAQALTIEQLIADACMPAKPAAQCQKVKAELGARQTKISRGLDALNDALLKRGLISEQGWVGPRGAAAGANARAASRQGASELLACLRVNLPTMPKAQAPTSDDSCARIWRRCGPDLTG